MRYWTGKIDQVPSGSLPLGEIARDFTGLRNVLDNLVYQKHESYNKIWRASVKEEASNWIMLAIGKASVDDDEDDWVPGTGWAFGQQKSKHACRLLLNKTNKTLLIERNDRVSQSAYTIANKLEILLNDSLDELDSLADWSINIRIDSDTSSFKDLFSQFETVHQFEVWLPLPNADLHDELNELLGTTKDAGGENVSVDLDSKRGINRQSKFVRGAIDLLDKGLSKVRARGLKPDGKYQNIYSDQHAKPEETPVEEGRKYFSLENADLLYEKSMSGIDNAEDN